MEIRKYREKEIPAMISIWNKVVEDGEAFPQEDFLNDTTGADFFCGTNILRRCRQQWKNCGALYSASKQYWPLWAYCKCELCC